MKKLLLIFKFIMLVLVIELIAIKLFPEYSKNQIYKSFNSKDNEQYTRVVKSRFHQFEYFKDLQVRSNLFNLLISFFTSDSVFSFLIFLYAF